MTKTRTPQTCNWSKQAISVVFLCEQHKSVFHPFGFFLLYGILLTVRLALRVLSTFVTTVRHCHCRTPIYVLFWILKSHIPSPKLKCRFQACTGATSLRFHLWNQSILHPPTGSVFNHQLRFLVQSDCSELLGKTTEEAHEGGATMSCHDVMNNVMTTCFHFCPAGLWLLPPHATKEASSSGNPSQLSQGEGGEQVTSLSHLRTI